jgi:hypothetical protein
MFPSPLRICRNFFFVSLEKNMKSTKKSLFFFKPGFYGAMIGVSCALLAQPACADDEIRVGAVLQVPFSLRSNQQFFDFSTIRVGLTCQYATVEEDKVTITQHTTETYVDGVLDPLRTSTTHTTQYDDGNQVLGLEGNIFVEVFNNWNGSAELLGFYGGNAVQGAFGGGYSFSDDFFLDAKVMLPYSEVGLRFLGNPEIYGGVKSLGLFEPAKDVRRVVAPIHRVDESID